MKFKVFVAIALVVIILLQAALIVILVYGGIKVKNAAESARDTVSSKSSSLNSSLNTVNDNLTKIGQELQNSPYANP